MSKILLGLILLIVWSPQITDTRPKLSGIIVKTGYSSSIVAEYAHNAVTVGERLDDQVVENLQTRLMATGLFSDVNINIVRTTAGDADLVITPKWLGSPEEFLIEGVSFEGFDTDRLRTAINKRGLSPGSPLLASCQRLKSILFDAGEEIYKNDEAAQERFERAVNTARYWIQPVATARYKILIKAEEP